MVGKRFITLRNALGLTQAEFADNLGLARSSWSEVENGRRTVQERHIKLILAAFPKVSEDWLRTGDGEMFRQPDQDQAYDLVKKYDFPELTNRLVDVYLQLDPEQQETVLEYARRLIASFIDDDAQERIIAEKTEAYRRELEAEAESKKAPQAGGVSIRSQTTDAG